MEIYWQIQNHGNIVCLFLSVTNSKNPSFWTSETRQAYHTLYHQDTVVASIESSWLEVLNPICPSGLSTVSAEESECLMASWRQKNMTEQQQKEDETFDLLSVLNWIAYGADEVTTGQLPDIYYGLCSRRRSRAVVLGQY